MGRARTLEMATPSTILATPLAALHATAGAKIGVWFACAMPDNFGDEAAEYRYARDTVALIDKNYRAYLAFTGPDRVRYLNATLTNNIKDLAVGHGAISLLLNPQGHILAESETYTFADRLLCMSYAMIRERLIEWLDKYIIMDDVTLTDETSRYGTLALEGPKAAAMVQELAGIDVTKMEDLSFCDGAVGSVPCRVSKRSPGGIPGAEFFTETANLPALWQILSEAAGRHGGGPVGYAAVSATRLSQGVPWFGYDFGEKQIPHEAGLQDSHISYTKGCYTGQEIVERVRSRGQVNRVRVTLKYDTPQPPASGTPLLSEGKEAGFTTRAAFSPALNVPIGMAYLRREKSTPGSTVELPEAAGSATVVSTPIA